MADSHWGTTPRASIAAECERRSRASVVEGCRELLRGEQVDDALLLALAGPAATPFLNGAHRDDNYWLRVWGARGLLWQWDDSALPEIATALDDEHWRVREMTLLVAKRNTLDELVPRINALRNDSNERVRRAAEKALIALG